MEKTKAPHEIPITEDDVEEDLLDSDRGGTCYIKEVRPQRIVSVASGDTYVYVVDEIEVELGLLMLSSTKSWPLFATATDMV